MNKYQYFCYANYGTELLASFGYDQDKITDELVRNFEEVVKKQPDLSIQIFDLKHKKTVYEYKHNGGTTK